MNDSFSNEFGSPARKKIFLFIISAVGLLYGSRLVMLQILEGNKFRVKSEAQAIKQIFVEPVRGAMYDRNGEIIVHNAPAFSITITPNAFVPETAPFLAKLLGVTPEEILDKVMTLKKKNAFTPIKIMRDVEYSVIAAIEENKEFLPGVDVLTESKRTYNFAGNFAHLIGYTKEINENQLKNNGDYYQPGDIIGTTGLEMSYENFLRGKKGIEFAAVNNLGQKVTRFNDGKNDSLAEDGFDLALGIDLPMQSLADSLLSGKNGAIVAIEPSSGEILAFVSKPDFDLRKFSGRTPGNLYAELRDDPEKPLFNRASMAGYPPGSTWKMLMGLAALQEGIITENSTFQCNGHFNYGGFERGCHDRHAHGTVNIRKAIQLSCNVFFFQLSLKMNMSIFEKYGSMFHFGQRTVLDLGEELPGNLPTAKYYGKGVPLEGRLINLAIGQGELVVTPLQMASYAAVLANRGVWKQPHPVRQIFNKKLGEWQPSDYKTETLPIDKRYFETVISGMYDVVNTPGGTASLAKLDSIVVCGKTGTAQAGKGKADHTWFVCFAPMDKPKIAMCVMVENSGGFGGTVAAPIAKKLLQCYLETPRQKKSLPEPPKTPSSNDGNKVAAVRQTNFKAKKL